MPFKSGKQRRYMHANLPEIAKRWERDYANGGIARVGLANGTLASTFFPEGNLQNIISNSSTQKDYNIGATKDLVENLPGGVVKDVLAPAAAATLSIPYDAIQAYQRMEPDSGIVGYLKALDAENPLSSAWERMVGASAPLAQRLSNLNFGSSAQAATPGDIMTSRSAFQDDYNYDRARVGEDTSDLSGMAEVRTPTPKQPKAQYNFPESDPWGFRRMKEERATPRSPQKIGMLDAFRNKFYRPATRAVGGYSIADLNKMNALGGYYSEPARAGRRTEKRGLNVLNRAALGKKVGNVNQLLGKYGYTGVPGSGTLSFTGKLEGDSSAGAGYSRDESGWGSSPFRGGGLASLWPR